MTAAQLSKSLQHQIDQLHLSYLKTDESPCKIEKRKKLEGYIREYLYLVPHSHKFCFDGTRHVLHRSVESKENFSAYKASNAWSALAVYAENLLSQPWRKEYRQIKLYSGYYKHHVESGLVGAEIMLEKMGYKHSNDNSMVLDNVMNPARIIDISKDCLIAMVECQILRTVYEEVMKKFPCSWQQVLQYRKSYVCSPEQLADAIINGTIPPHSDHMTASTHSLCSHYPTYKPVSMQDCLYNHYPADHYTCPSYCPSMQTPMPSYSQSYCQTMPLKPHDVYPPWVNGYHCPSVMMNYPYPSQTTVPANYNYPVPTGQLIELDPPQETYYCHRRSNSDHKIISHQRKSSCDRYSTDTCSRSTPSDDMPLHGSKSKFPTLGKNDGSVSSDWDFTNASDVRNLTKPQNVTKSKSGYNSSSLDNLKVNGRVPMLDDSAKLRNSVAKLSVSSSSRSKHEISDTTDSSQRLSSNDNPSTYSPSSYQSLYSPSKSKINLVTELGNKPSKHSTSNNQIRNDSLLVDTSELVVNLISPGEWSCVNCTYLNKNSVKICEMCLKSKTSGNEAAPLISGGRECPQCTLVNEKDLTKCVACSFDLKDSSTYV